MIISAASDYRAAAQRILPPFLFHYIDGGAYAEHTLRRNVEDLAEIADQIVERREKFGFSYIVFSGDRFEALAPVVKKLAGT